MKLPSLTESDIHRDQNGGKIKEIPLPIKIREKIYQNDKTHEYTSIYDYSLFGESNNCPFFPIPDCDEDNCPTIEFQNPKTTLAFGCGSD